MKNLFKFKWLLLSFILSIASINTALADAQFDNVYIYYSLDGGTTETGYSCNPSYGDFANYAVVTSELKITQVYYRYRKYNGNVCGTQLVWWDGSTNHYYGYNTSGFVENCWSWGDEGNVGSEQRNTSYNFSISTADKASGIYTFYYCWQMWGSLATSDGCVHNWYMPSEATKYALHYTINPPDVKSYDVTATGALAGDGSSGNPYIVAYNGTLQLDLSNAKQKHTDANSSIKYSVDGTNWGTAQANTRKTIGNITSTTTANWVVYAKYENGSTNYYGTSDKLVGATNAKTTYYKSESRYNISASASPAAGGIVTPTSSTATGQYSGGDITAEEADGYTFSGWTIVSGSGYFGTSGTATTSSTANTKFRPTAAATLRATFTPNDYAITLNPSLSPSTGTNGTTSIDVTYNATTGISRITKPTREGYTFAGYEDASHNLVIDANGDFTTAGGYISDGKYVYADDLTLTAKWTDNGTYVFTGGAWNTASNWTKGSVPGSTADVILLDDASTPSGTTTVNSIRIATSGTYTPVGGDGITANGSLTVSAGSALKVATSVQNCVISANAPASVGSTTSSTLAIESSAALAWGGTDPGDATVNFYTCSGGTPGSEDAVNQYFGIPFTSLNSDNYSNAWIFAVSGGSWAEVNGATLQPWTGYNIIEKLDEGDSHGNTYSLTGTLLGRGASLGSGVSAGSETLYANSWVAPIAISEISYAGGDGTIYIFSAKSVNDLNKEVIDNPVGNYASCPINESSAVYIPSMQSFSTWGGTSLTISYSDAVYNKIAAGNNINHAPRRSQGYDYREAIWATQDTLTLHVESMSGWSDVLKMYIHEEFSMDYENGWDGPKIEGMWEAPSLYALTNNRQMAVNCIPTAENQVIGFHAGTAANEYTFQFKYSGDDELYLRDTKTGVETLISAENTYTFTSESNDSDLRFIIVNRTPATTTDIETVSGVQSTASGVQKVLHNGALYIIREGHIFDAQGNMVK